MNWKNRRQQCESQMFITDGGVVVTGTHRVWDRSTGIRGIGRKGLQVQGAGRMTFVNRETPKNCIRGV